MDVQGETILGTWLYGGRVDHDIEDPSWSSYMMAHDGLRRQVLARLKPAVQKMADMKKLGRFRSLIDSMPSSLRTEISPAMHFCMARTRTQEIFC